MDRLMKQRMSTLSLKTKSVSDIKVKRRSFRLTRRES